MTMAVHAMTTPPRAMVLFAPGSNRDLEAAQALELAGARPEIVPLADVRRGCKSLSTYQLLVLPGGFSYADALGAGKLFALDLNTALNNQLQDFIASGKPVLGICNGFQALLKAGLLGGERWEVRSESENFKLPTSHLSPRTSTLTFNQSGHFECRWVTLAPRSRACIWTRELSDCLDCPVAHGEGNFTVAGEAALADLEANDQVALVYVRPDGTPALGHYPSNPNGSARDIAGLCNPAGNVLGLMPHPENHLFPYQHPRWTRGERGGLGLKLFEQGVTYAAQL